LFVCAGDAVGGINANRIHVVRLAYFKDICWICTRSYELATSTIEYIVAINARVCYGRVTNLETEDVGAHEVMPAMDLLKRIVVAIVARETVRVNQSSKRIAAQISAERIEFTAVIVRRKAYVHLIDVTGEENIRRGTEDLDPCKRARGHNARTVAWFGAVGHCFGFHITNSLVLVGRRPKAEIVDMVQHRELAVRVGAFSSAVAFGVAKLRATACWVGVDLVGNLIRVREALIC